MKNILYHNEPVLDEVLEYLSPVSILILDKAINLSDHTYYKKQAEEHRKIINDDIVNFLKSFGINRNINNLIKAIKLKIIINKKFRHKLSNTIPESFCTLTNLKYLEFSAGVGFGIKSLPDSIGNLTKLTELNIHNNQLTSLPDSLGNLTNLTELNIHNNQLTSLPDSMRNLTKLQVLIISQNKLTSLSDSIGKLTNLTNLSIYDNQLTRLPDSIGNLTKLANFILCANKLFELPDSIGNLTNLRNLDISYNYFRVLPKTMITNLLLNHLVHINISNNHYNLKLPLAYEKQIMCNHIIDFTYTSIFFYNY